MKSTRTKFRNNIEYAVDGIRHREDGPAFIARNGSMYWYKHGQFHREDGPAVIYNDGSMFWYIDGNRHREDGPAIIYPDGHMHWFRNGESCNKDSLNSIVSPRGETYSQSE